MEHMYYAGSSFEAWLSAVDSAAEQGGGDAAAAAQTVHVPPELGQEEARAKFPVGVAALDSLVETPAFLDMYEQCLGDKAVFCDAHLFHRDVPGLHRSLQGGARPLQGHHHHVSGVHAQGHQP